LLLGDSDCRLPGLDDVEPTSLSLGVEEGVHALVVDASPEEDADLACPRLPELQMRRRALDPDSLCHERVGVMEVRHDVVEDFGHLNHAFAL
jgi:hypothetical protein